MIKRDGGSNIRQNGERKWGGGLRHKLIRQSPVKKILPYKATVRDWGMSGG